MSYRKHLFVARGLSPATIRNYIQDLSPFFEYLAKEEVNFGRDAKDLRTFIQCHGATGVSGMYRP